MSRPLRLSFGGATYHILTRGNNRELIFKEDEDRKKYLEFLEKYLLEFSCALYAYVLMPNHVHYILETKKPNLSNFMHRLHTSYTIYFNHKYNRVGHLLQGRYKSILIDKESYLLELSRYIHLNPVRANLVQCPSDYKWSSYSCYVYDKKDGFVDTTQILGQIGKDEAERCIEYEKFVLDGVGKKITFKENILNGMKILGNKDFLNRIQEKQKNRNEERIDGQNSFIDKIISTAAKHYGLVPGDFIKKKVYKFLPRQICIYICRNNTNETLTEIGKKFGGVSHSAIAETVNKIEEARKKDRRVESDIQKILAKLTV